MAGVRCTAVLLKETSLLLHLRFPLCIGKDHRAARARGYRSKIPRDARTKALVFPDSAEAAPMRFALAIRLLRLGRQREVDNMRGRIRCHK